MKLAKKVVSLVSAGAVVLLMATSTFAAGITAEEQAILDQAAAAAAELGVPETNATYQSYYAQAEKYLTDNDMTADEITAATTALSEAKTAAAAEMEAAGVTSVLDLPSDTLSSLTSTVAAQAETTLQAAGINVAISADGTVTLTTEDGTTVASTAAVIKQTGSDMTATVCVVVAVIGAIAACVIVAKKKDLFATEA